MPPVKKIVLWLLDRVTALAPGFSEISKLTAAFALYAILVSPDDAASLVGTIWDILVNGIKNIGRFFDTLLSR